MCDLNFTVISMQTVEMGFIRPLHGSAICVESLDLKLKFAHIMAHTLLDAAQMCAHKFLHIPHGQQGCVISSKFTLQTEVLLANGRLCKGRMTLHADLVCMCLSVI